jgi:dihydropteridine reductase
VGDEVIEKLHLMMAMNLYSSMLSVHLAKKYLNSNSLLVLTGANSVKEGVHTWMIQYQLSKNSVHYLTDILTKTKNELPENTKLITILPDTIDTEINRKSMPDADFSKWTSPVQISEKIKYWADLKEYPQETYYKF